MSSIKHDMKYKFAEMQWGRVGLMASADLSYERGYLTPLR